MTILGGVFIALLLVKSTIADFIDTPVVYKNHLTGKCVAIESPEGVRDCSIVPQKYDVAFIDPDVTYAEIKSGKK